MKAICQCGQLSAAIPGPSDTIVACHCQACQRRTGAPFGVVAYYPAEQVTLSGEATRFDRAGASGDLVEQYFCPTCGTTVHIRSARHPSKIGIAIGAIADPAYPAPIRSVWEENRHGWVAMPDGITRLPRGRAG